jgi:hypothetical protein
MIAISNRPAFPSFSEGHCADFPATADMSVRLISVHPVVLRLVVFLEFVP